MDFLTFGALIASFSFILLFDKDGKREILFAAETEVDRELVCV